MSQKQQQAPSKITMLAPMALVLAIYSFAFYSPQQSKLRAAQARFEKLLEGQHDTEHQVSATWQESSRLRGELREIKAEVEQLAASNDRLQSDRRQLRQQLELPIRPAATMQRLTSLMESHRMLVLESQPEAGSSHQVSEVVRPVIDLLADRKASYKLVSSASDGREIYEVKIRGRFQDLKSALKSLSVDLEHVVPLSLQMESLELSSSQAHQSQRIWTLKILV